VTATALIAKLWWLAEVKDMHHLHNICSFHYCQHISHQPCCRSSGACSCCQLTPSPGAAEEVAATLVSPSAREFELHPARIRPTQVAHTQ
jgi:hypothetical protein